MSRSSPRCPKRICPASGARRGAVVLLLLLGLVVLLGVGSLALNLTWLSSHQVQLRQACEAAALAGAAQLMDPTPNAGSSTSDPAALARVAAATAQAQAFFAGNSSAVLQTTGVNPDVIAGWCADPTLPHGVITPWTGVGPVNSLSVRGMLRRSNGQAVILWFGNLFGLNDAEPAAVAAASMDQRIYGFRPVGFVRAPVVPLLALISASDWPSSVAGTAAGLPDNYWVDSHTGNVIPAPDGIAEITLQVPLEDGSLSAGQAEARWLWLTAEPTDYTLLAQQVSLGLAASDLELTGDQFALRGDGTLLLSPASAPGTAQATALKTALLGIRGVKRIWPIGSLQTVDGQEQCRVTGFVAGCVVDSSLNADSLAIVVQACAIQTCTGLLRSGTPRNPWIGKLILNE